MSREVFNDDCEGCRPVLLDGSGRPIPDDHPAMKVIMKIWNGLAMEQREAFHRFTCLNSRDPEDMEVVRLMVDQFRKEQERGH